MSKDNLISGLIGMIFGIVAAVIFTLQANNPVASRARINSSEIADNNPNKSFGEINDKQQSEGAANNSMQPQVAAALDAARDNPKDVRAQLNAAGMYYQIGQFDQALPFVKNALAIEPNNSSALIAAADTYFEQGDFTEAANFYERVLKQQPENINARIDLGSTYFQRAPPDYQRAITEYHRALDLEPTHPDALHNLVIAQLASKSYTEAENTIRRFASAHPDNPTLAELRNTLRDTQRAASN
jgi:tetratricopeptide (TPR) repeat protein